MIPSFPAKPTTSMADQRLLTIFPFALVAILLIGGYRLAKESTCSATNRAQAGFSIQHGNREDDKLLNIFEQGCNVFEGKWVLDKQEYDMYTEESCPYLERQVTCRKNGRPDALYQKWRWKPHGCNLPRFNAVKLLEKLRNKRLMFVGDSIQRSQWESMVCLLQSAIPEEKKAMHKDPPRRIFVAKEFNATVEFYWAPFIVESNSDHATKHHVQRRMVRLDSIAKHSRNWEGVHILVFESYIWWMYKPLINATNGSDDIKEFDVRTAYRLAMQTWANWLESRFDQGNQKAFFMSLSPTHLRSSNWKVGNQGNCFNESYPMVGPFRGTDSGHEIMGIVDDTFQKLQVNVILLNITRLSEYRKDGHTSIYTERSGKLLTEEQRSQPDVYADCIHWCLPGVPDTWNLILYSYLVLHHT